MIAVLVRGRDFGAAVDNFCEWFAEIWQEVVIGNTVEEERNH
jgi:hypothetical protein